MDTGDRDAYRPDPLGQDTNYGRPSLGRQGKIFLNVLYYNTTEMFLTIKYHFRISG